MFELTEISMRFLNLAIKALALGINRVLWTVRPDLSTKFICRYFKTKGMLIYGMPNYLSAKIWFDGTDYSLIELNEGCTISSNVRILTHDWSINTIAREMNIIKDKPIGIFRKIRVGRNAFIGTNSILMPGCDVGDGAIVGAGTVVRGKVPPFSIVIGNPMIIVGNSKDYVKKHLNSHTTYN